MNRLSTWYEDLEEYEGNLEEMAAATLDQVIMITDVIKKKPRNSTAILDFSRRIAACQSMVWVLVRC